MYDLKQMVKMKKYGDLTPKAMKAFNDLNAAVFTDGALTAKVKELMALSIAVTTQCPYCIEFHNKQARAKGATEAEIAEAVMVSAALRAGGSVTHGLHCLE